MARLIAGQPVRAEHAEILARAQPYLDTRRNDVHVAIVYQLAQRLLRHYPTADEAVVLPAAILHDVGWKMVPEERQLTAFGPKMRDPELRRVHEAEGARIAGEILDSLDYDAERRDEIIAIIDGHDSREHALSTNDKLVKDADKAWRFSEVAIEVDHHRFEIPYDDYTQWLEEQIDDWFFTPEATQMAYELLAAAGHARLTDGDRSTPDAQEVLS